MFVLLGLIANRHKSVAKTIIARTIITVDHDILFKSALVKGGPITCPADPAAVVIPRTNDLLSGEVYLPTTASIGPNPVPAIPHPIIKFKN